MSKKKSPVTEIIENCKKIGDVHDKTFDQTKDLKVSHAAMEAYKTSLIAAKAQVIYKKLVGRPGKIEFFE